MSRIRLYGDTSGYVELKAPDVSNDGLVTLPEGAIATETYVDSAVTGLAAESYVDSAVTGLASESYVDTNAVAKSNHSGQSWMMWGEENGTAPSIGDRLSLGNGSTVTYLPMPLSGTVTGGSLWVRAPAGTTNTTVQVVKNGVLQGGTNITVYKSGVTAVTFASPVPFSSGDTIQLQFTQVNNQKVVGTLVGFWS